MAKKGGTIIRKYRLCLRRSNGGVPDGKEKKPSEEYPSGLSAQLVPGQVHRNRHHRGLFRLLAGSAAGTASGKGRLRSKPPHRRQIGAGKQSPGELH